MRVLVVDDNPEIVWCLQIMLEHEGFEVKSAKDGHEGYGAYLEFKPEVVLTDIQMPGDNGLKMMEHIRTHHPMVKTIYMSGDLSSYCLPLEEEARKYPVSLLEKPFSKWELMELLSSASYQKAK